MTTSDIAVCRITAADHGPHEPLGRHSARFPGSAQSAPYGGVVPGSSLILAVIVAVWVVYLLQYWIRRRDHVATARSVDRFSDAMRVLERRRALSANLSTTPRPVRSYAVSPARPAHPDVVVKRAHPGLVLAQTRDGAAGRLAESTSRAGASATRVFGSASRAGASASRAVGSASRATAVRASRVSAATRRGLVLLTGAVLLLTSVVLGAMEVLPWWSVLVGLAGLILAIGYARASAKRARRHARSPVRPRGTAGPRKATPVRVRRQRRSAPLPAIASRPRVASGPSAAATDITAHGGSAAAVLAARSTVRRTSEVYGSHAAERVSASTGTEEALPSRGEVLAAPAVTEAAPLPGTWQPVPVPPPTYTLKAKATNASDFTQPSTASTASRPHTPSAARAATTPVAELPFDGHAMALEEESEELPAVHRVG